MRYYPLVGFQVFRFLGDFRALGSFLANSTENFSPERPVFVAFPAPRVPKIWHARFSAQLWRIPRCSFYGSKNYRFPTQKFTFLCLSRPHNGNFFSIFQFLVVFGPNGPRAGWETWSFQYRTPRSRSVIPSPHSFSAENIFLKKKVEIGFWIFLPRPLDGCRSGRRTHYTDHTTEFF